MKALFWSPPWTTNGDPLFFLNCVRKHLIPQANLLAASGFEVEFVMSKLMASARGAIDARVRVIELDAAEALHLAGGFADPSARMYADPDDPMVARIRQGLEPRLAARYDCILLWETPVPFLEQMYPDALVVHQMPGAFSRAPYPHTVTFDPQGLYRRGTLFQQAEAVQNGIRTAAETELAAAFSTKARDGMAELCPFRRGQLNAHGQFRELALLPLQVSAHYAFKADAGYGSQADFLFDVLSRSDADQGVVVTQYVSPHVQDTVLTADLAARLVSQWPNLVFRPEFDQLPSVSQYLVPLMDRVITCSSSVAVQAMIWNRRIQVVQPTFLKPFDSGGCSHEQLVDRHAKTLAFVLGRQQVQASRVVNDASFLVALIEELHARRNNPEMLDRLVPFHEIDPDYAARLLGEFRVARAAKDAGETQSRLGAQLKQSSRFAAALTAPGVKAVSFDVFDTLIHRPVEVPADLYHFLEPGALAATGGQAEDFAKLRLAAEVETREAAAGAEITLDQIYSRIGEQLALTDEMVATLKQREIEAELWAVRARESGQEMWERARRSGLPIYVISDMYLPHEVVERMLAQAGYTGYRKLYVSSTYGVRKKEGGLFDVFLRDTGLAASALLHIGDNKAADEEQPAARGIATFRVARALDRLRGNLLYAAIYPPKAGVGERARSAVAGLTALRLFERPGGTHEKDSHALERADMLGYAALGPVVAGYMMWLGRQARRDGITRLYFLSREGWLLKQAYDALHAQDATAVPSSYLYASRRATRVASLASKADIAALAGQPYRGGVSLRALLESRFGLTVLSASAQEVVAELGYPSPDVALAADAPCKRRFLALCLQLADDILAVAARERVAYLDYLGREGFLQAERPAVVDLGWKANMQGALGRLLDRPLDGYYYATLQGAESWLARGHRVSAYAGDFLAGNTGGVLVKNRHISEFLFCHVEASLICMRVGESGPTPVLRDEQAQGQRRSVIEEVHRGAIDFARDLHGRFQPWLGQIHIDPALAERAYGSFLEAPHAADAELLVGQFFEDAMGGVQREYVIAPSEAAKPSDSVWRKGAAVLAARRQAAKAKPKPPPAKPLSKPVAKAVAKPAAVPAPAMEHAQAEEREAELEESQADLEATPWLRGLETAVIRKLAPERKLRKYERDRELFFADSKNPIARTWARIAR